MTKLIWSAAGTRYYESGIDRGVLYVSGFNGVAWDGLISVSEKPSGGEPTPYYIDGIKQLNLASSTEYEATLTAFYSPPEFARCRGVIAANGLSFTQQPRIPFGFAYRTKLGNDTVGADFAYKLHLVYNALAKPAQLDHTTTTDKPEPLTPSWDITTTPPPVTGRKPTAHLVITSNLATAARMTSIENLLYGTASAAPRLPLPAEVATIFGV